MDSDEIAALSVAALSEAYGTAALSPVDVAYALLDRIDVYQPAVNAFVHVDRPTTLAMARESERRWLAREPLGPLDGIPVTIKDLLAVQGWPLVRGSPALQGKPPSPADAAPVARLREAGAMFLGKTATPDAGSRIVTRSPVHGVTRNPHDLRRTPGGSSGGAASALALGIGPIALGTDGAGSIRIPAAWTGTVGLKPSFGRVPVFPPGVFMPHSVVGPMGRSVDDVAAMLDILARPDDRDPYMWPIPFDPARAALHTIDDLRVGMTTDFGFASPPIDAAAGEAVEQVARVLQAAGAHVDTVEPRWPTDPFDSFMVFWEATYAGSLPLSFTPEEMCLIDPDLRAIGQRGMGIDVVAYHRALSDRVGLAAASKALFNRFDLLIGPVMPCPPPLAEDDAPAGYAPGDWRWCPFTYVWNMTGQPAASVPVGTDRDGMPVGVQIVAGMGREEDILRAARFIEAAVGQGRLPELTTPTGPSGRSGTGSSDGG